MKKLIAYLSSAYPNRDFSVELILALKESGVDLIELGIPFSDPIADGEVIQEISKLSIANGYKFKDLLYISKKVSKEIQTLWMGYFNSFYTRGLDISFQEAKKLNINSVIIPDLPYEEYLRFKDIFIKNQISNIAFIAPTHKENRIKNIVQNSKNFIYLVAYAGITGKQKDENLEEIITYIQKYTSTPVYLGFGVDEKNAKEKSKNLDGVIVGSAFMKVLLDNKISYKEKLNKICAKAKIIKNEIS